jgi:hypothetical protein
MAGSSGARTLIRRCRREGNKVKALSFGAPSRPANVDLGTFPVLPKTTNNVAVFKDGRRSGDSSLI